MTGSYRKISSFGRSTIRKFSNSVSEMKKFAARDFEDVLQCAGPCFEGLFPRSVDSQIQDLLFIMACWHAFAKLRLHTDSSLDVFRGLTAAFTWQIRHFANKVCPKFDTVETPSERAAIIRADATRAKKDAQTSTRGMKRMAKRFNINTPKFHSIVHYPDNIAKYGTTDSYSTQMVCYCIGLRLLDRPGPTDPLSAYARIRSYQTHTHSSDQTGRADLTCPYV